MLKGIPEPLALQPGLGYICKDCRHIYIFVTWSSFMFTKCLNTLMFSVSLVHLSWNIPPSVNMQVVLNLYAMYSLVKVKVMSRVWTA